MSCEFASEKPVSTFGDGVVTRLIGGGGCQRSRSSIEATLWARPVNDHRAVPDDADGFSGR